MKQKPVPHALSVFVCTNGGSKKCQGGKKLYAQLKKEVKQRKLHQQVRVCPSGCMDQCDKGPNVMIFPDNIWLCRVRDGDIDEIMKHLAAHLYLEEGC